VTLFDTSEGRRAARLLEWPALLEAVAQHASLERGAAEVRAVEPVASAGELEDLWIRVAELHAYLTAGADLPLASMVDLQDTLGLDARRHGPLEPDALAAVGAAARDLADLRDAIGAASGRLPVTAERWADTGEVRPVGDHLLAALESDGRIRDSASPTLGGLRRAEPAAAIDRHAARYTAESERQRHPLTLRVQVPGGGALSGDAVDERGKSHGDSI